MDFCAFSTCWILSLFLSCFSLLLLGGGGGGGTFPCLFSLRQCMCALTSLFLRLAIKKHFLCLPGFFQGAFFGFAWEAAGNGPPSRFPPFVPPFFSSKFSSLIAPSSLCALHYIRRLHNVTPANRWAKMLVVLGTALVFHGQKQHPHPVPAICFENKF